MSNTDNELDWLVDLFPMDLTMRLIREADEAWCRENADYVPFTEPTGGMQGLLSEMDEEAADALGEIMEGMVGKTVAELGPSDDGSVARSAGTVCGLVVSHLFHLSEIIGRHTKEPVRLTEELAPVELPEVFDEDHARDYPTWENYRDLAYFQTFEEDSDEGRQIAEAFASNIRTFIEEQGELRLPDGITIKKDSDGYVAQSS